MGSVAHIYIVQPSRVVEFTGLVDVLSRKLSFEDFILIPVQLILMLAVVLVQFQCENPHEPRFYQRIERFVLHVAG